MALNWQTLVGLKKRVRVVERNLDGYIAGFWVKPAFSIIYASVAYYLTSPDVNSSA